MLKTKLLPLIVLTTVVAIIASCGPEMSKEKPRSILLEEAQINIQDATNNVFPQKMASDPIKHSCFFSGQIRNQEIQFSFNADFSSLYIDENIETEFNGYKARFSYSYLNPITRDTVVFQLSLMKEGSPILETGSEGRVTLYLSDGYLHFGCHKILYSPKRTPI